MKTGVPALVFFLAIIWLAIGNAFSAPLPGSQYIYLGFGVKEASMGFSGIADLDGIDGASYNPASVADMKRLANSLTIQGLGGPNYLIAPGIAIPGPFGISSVQLLYTGTPYTNALSSLWGLEVSFAKPLSMNLFWGAGLKLFNTSMLYAAGTNVASDWQLGLDTGIIYKESDGLSGFGFIDPAFGLVLKNIGKTISYSGYDPFPALGLGVGTSFCLVKSDPYKLKLQGDLTVPFNPFSSIISIGMENNFFDILKVRMGYYNSLSNNGLNGMSSFTFGLGLSEKIPLKAETDLDFSYALQNQTFNGVSEWVHSINMSIAWGYYDDEPPQTSIMPDVTYFSPNFDSVQDKVRFSLSIKDNVMVAGWQLNILNQDKETIRTFKSLQSPEYRSVNLQKAAGRIFESKTQVDVPREIVWYGKNDKGVRMPDGEYFYELIAWDENFNSNRTHLASVFIDTKTPVLAVKPTDTIFSPNGDGVKETIGFAIQASNLEPIDVIQASILTTNGLSVKHFDYSGKAPSQISWDGKDDNGKLVNEGLYSFIMSISNPAGNAAIFTNSVFRLVTNIQTVELTVENPEFSPGDDKAKSYVKLKPVVSDRSGLEKWSLSIYDSESNVVKEINGKNVLPADWVWSGRNQNNKLLPDGWYACVLALEFDSGNHPQSKRYLLHIDTKAPVVKVRPEYLAFSPNGDGIQDTITFFQSVEGEPGDLFTMKIKDQSDQVITNQNYSITNFPGKFTWNGLDHNGKPLPDGVYSYAFDASDAAGNKSQTTVNGIVLKTGIEKIGLQSSVTAISPGNREAKTNTVFTCTAMNQEYIREMELDVFDSNKILVYTSANNRFIGRISWDGIDTNGRYLPDGIYTCTLKVRYTFGDSLVSQAKTVLIKTDNPLIQLSTDHKAFSPIPDSSLETLIIRQNVKQDESTIYEAKLLNMTGKAVKTYHWKASVPDILVWDGLDEAGNPSPEGTYSYRLTGLDVAGNKTVKELTGLKLVRTLDKLTFTNNNMAFSPHAPGGSNNLVFRLELSSTNELARSTLTIFNNNGEAVRQLQVSPFTKAFLAWDGLDNASNYVSDGYYTAEMACEFNNGISVSARISNILFCQSPPRYKLSLSPEIFTPDDFSDDNLLYINLSVDSLAGLDSWDISIYNQADSSHPGFLIKRFSGTGNTKQLITWNGLGDVDRDQVESGMEYLAGLSAQDRLGNKLTNVTRKITTGILLTKDPLGINIRVPSIRFEPGKDVLLYDSYKVLHGVIQAIRQIASDPAKFGISQNYTIEISAHTDDPALSSDEREVLSQKRARKIYEYLLQEDIDPKKLKWTGYGDTRPYKIISPDLSPEKAKEYHYLNERVEFLIQN